MEHVGLMTPRTLQRARKRQVRIVQAGDNTLHPIEAEYLRPEVHSLMAVDRPVIRAADADRVVLWVRQPLKDLAGTYVRQVHPLGRKADLRSSKSKAVPVPERSTCASTTVLVRPHGVETGCAFWPMAQQYRHLIPDEFGAACLQSQPLLSRRQRDCQSGSKCLPAVLNSTLFALFKTYYGRYAGTEGNLKTEVVDVKLLEVPDVRGVSEEWPSESCCFQHMQARPTQPSGRGRVHAVPHDVSR